MAAAPPDPELVEYWRRMGVPASALPQPVTTLGSTPKDSLFLGGVDSEPFFIYVDPDKHEMFPALEMPKDRVGEMISGSDAQVQIAMSRLRLSGPDDKEFRRFNSGGLLFDVQQDKGKSNDIGTLAWSVFSAILPSDKPSGGAPSASAATPPGADTKPTAKAQTANKKSDTPPATDAQPKKKKSRAGTMLSDAFAALKGGTSSPPLQPLEQVHTMQLPKGVGHTKLTVFVKDRKKSVFGTFINMFGSMAGGAAGSYLSLLNLGGIAEPALTSVRTLAGKLHVNDEQRIVFGTEKDIDLVVARDQIASEKSQIRLVPGQYIVLRKGHLKNLSGKTTNVKMFDGYMMGNNADFTTYYDQAAEFASGVTYLSLTVAVQPTKIAPGCKSA